MMLNILLHRQKMDCPSLIGFNDMNSIMLLENLD